jgi:hypothetical protein
MKFEIYLGLFFWCYKITWCASKLRVRLNALQLFTSCSTPIWSGKMCTPIFLEWEAVHFNIFGVETFPLQKFSLPWSKQSCTQSSLQKFGRHLKSTPKVLECTLTLSPLQNFWSALQVHSKKFGVHSKSILKNWTQHFTPKRSTFWSAQLPTPIFLEWTAFQSISFWVVGCSLLFSVGVDTCPLQNVGVHVVKFWSAFSLTLN